MIKCTFTPKNFEGKVLEEVSFLLENLYDETTGAQKISDKDIRDKLYKIFQNISEQMGLTGTSKIEQALNIIKNSVMSFFDETQQLDDNDIRASLTAWKHTPEPQDNTADHLVKDNEKLERINEDPFETYYQFAMNARIRAKQQANKVGVRSILYNENGVINSLSELNESIRSRQQELLENIVNYLRTRISTENQLKHPEIFNNPKLYNGENYTGIVEQIQELYGNVLGKENFDPRILNKYYNDGDYNILDAYNSWIILNNFDTILQQIFGKAISINPDMAKFTGKNKYRIAGGSNVYSTWRTSEEIDMAKEINNITQAIVTTIPFIPKGSTTPSQNNLKFNEFLYIVSKIKGLSQLAENDWNIQFGNTGEFSEEFQDKYKGKSFLDLINSIRTNPQEILPDIFQLLNNSNIISALVGAGVIESNTFLNVDLNLINSIYEGLFNKQNPNSLLSIQNNSGFDGINYFAFIAQTIDSSFKSSYLQYFRNLQGEIFIRNMYDQSIGNIEYTIRDTINSINSKMMQQNFPDFQSKYDIKTEKRQFTEGEFYNVTYNGYDYVLSVNNGQITATNDKLGPVTNIDFLNTLIDTFKELPNNIVFTIKDYHKGPLKVIVSLNKNNVTFELNGQQFEAFNSKSDYDSLSDFIQEILKQNLNIDNAYLDAYKNRFKYGAYGSITTELMQVVSRVIANKYLSNTILNNLTPTQITAKLNQIFGKEKSSIKPTFNKQLGEINLLTESTTGIILNLAEAKAQATGRLTSSQIIDSNGNAVASSSLSRLLSAYTYQINQQIHVEGAAAQDFSLWNTGVFKGIQQMKEIQDNSDDSSKSSIEFSNAEMEYGTVFIDFLQGLLDNPVNGKTPLKKGLTTFIPSENSDKTYIGRMLVDLSKLQVNGESIYDILRKDPRRIHEITPILAKELGDFYDRALANINSTWTRVGLLVGEKNISYGNWGTLALKSAKERKSTLQYVNDLVTKYNNENPNNPIVLIDQVHYVSDKKGNLLVNESLLENVARFKDSTKLSDFLMEQNTEVVKQLLKDRLKVPVTPEIRTKIMEWTSSNWKEASKWIDKRTGEIIFAKVYDYNLETGEEEFVSDIRRPNDLSLLEQIDLSVTGIEINPILESYNILNYFLTQEFMGSTVGMFYAHPNKKAQDVQKLLREGKINTKEAHKLILEDEKARKAAQDKRNVSFTAAMHSFLKGLIQGIPDEINIAIMSDPYDYFQTISGEIFDIKPFDGATFENPFFGEMENASLGGAKVGVNKKTFTHYYDERTGTGGIIKTANFPLTNDRIRGSKFYQRMMRNMTDRIWKNEDGSNFIIKQDGHEDYNETRTKAVFYVSSNNLVDYNGHQIEFTNSNDVSGRLYFKQNGKYYHIASIEYLGNNQFRRYLQEVNIYGQALDSKSNPTEIISEEIQLVDTNYKLWNLFGGAYSMEMSEGNTTLQYTENSIKLVSNIINKIGNKKNEIVRTQSDIFQPLKHSDIHLMPTVGAVKQGAGNINTVDKYGISDPNQINFMKVKMNQAGIQLDKEHHADDEDLSIMTQVISACAARGYTQAQQQQMLNALASLAKSGIREYLDAFNEFFENPNGNLYERNQDGTIKLDSNDQPIPIKDKDGNPISTSQNYQQVILDTLVNALVHSTNSAATLQLVTQELINKAKEGKEITFKDANIPYSDPAVFRKLHSTIAVALTRGAIKIKVQGVLSVLCPSFGVVKMYHNRTLNTYDSDEQIQAEQEVFDALPENELVNDIGRLKLGRTYKLKKEDGSIELRNVVTQNDYYVLKSQITNGEYYSIKEQFAPNPEKGFEGGRELGSYNATFQAIRGTAQPMISTEDLKQQIYSVRSWQERIEKAEQLGLNIDKDTEPRNVYEYVCQNFPILSRASVMKHTGMKPADLTKFSKILRTNGISIEKASEQIYGNLPEYLQNTTEDTQIAEIIRDLLLNSQSYTDIIRAIYRDRIDEALKYYDNEYQEYQNYINETPLTYNINDLASVHKLSDLQELKKNTKDPIELQRINKEIDEVLKDVQWDLNILSGLKNVDKTKNSNDRTIRLDNGTEIQVDPKSINIEPYEVIMPKIYASVFGLEPGDDLNVIKEDKDFFVKRLIQSIKPKVSNQFYSIGLMNIGSRNSMYILDRNQAIPNNTDRFIQKEISQITEKGKIWRVRNGEKMYQMQKGDTVYEYRHPDGTSYEVIVSDKPEFYVKNNSFVTINRSSSYNVGKFIEIIEKNIKDLRIKEYKEALDAAIEAYGDNQEEATLNIQNVELSDLKDSPFGNYLEKVGHILHTSFLKSLQVVAARIPAQSMQSFMPMKVVAFEGPDINTAYVSTAQLLFQGSDYDIDAVSLASYTFDKSGRYVIHSPFANIETIENLEASEEIPFPTGKHLEISDESTLDYEKIISVGTLDLNKPFSFLATDKGYLRARLDTPKKIKSVAKLIDYCNKLGYIPAAKDSRYSGLLEQLAQMINNHNDYINNDRAENFSKNYVVSSMYKIGLSPANMIESQQAMDSITGPLKDVANNTIKAQEESLENPGGFTTNIHGISQNMAGKKGVGICAVGLKSFFALTSRYNEVLRSGTIEEQERLKSDVVIAGKHYKMLANAYGINISNQAVAQIISELSNQDQALILSGLLSLATDNAKELALDKLNAANMLGMYIYGITIGMDFQTIANIICSKTGLIINEMMKGNSFLQQKGMSIQNIFDYLETAPNLHSSVKLSEMGNTILLKISQQELFNLVHQGSPIERQFLYLDQIKQEINQNILSDNPEYNELHRLIEEAEDYIERVNSIDQQIYDDFKKLNEGADELRRLGQLLHINQGLENSYSKSINYIDIVTSVIVDRQYSKYREWKREIIRQSLIDGKRPKINQPDTDKYKFNFHQFVTNKDYREAWIDIYEGKCNEKRFTNSQIYRNQFASIFPQVRNTSTIETAYRSVISNLKPSKVFFNILDVLQVPHFEAYLQSADMLHQAMMKTSVKYRSIFNLGKKAINRLNVYSTDNKEKVYRRTEQMVDRIMRDRYYLSKSLLFILPRGSEYFIKEGSRLVKKTVHSSTPIELGTDEGNASFKLFMESVVIPNLQKGKYGQGNNVNIALAKNEFIKSLVPVLYKHNPHYNVTINYAPGINMSPRSDAEKALFEKIKYDFNAFRSGSLSQIKYRIGNKDWDIPELFYYYNQIAFGSRPGENTLTSIFQDILDYRPIKEFRDYESQLDLEGIIEVDDNYLIKEVALRDNPWSSNMESIYYEDPDSGELALWNKTTGIKQDENIYNINGYVPNIIKTNPDSKNYENFNSDISTRKIILFDNKEKDLKESVTIRIEKNKIVQIIRGDNKTELKIPEEAKPYFDNPPVKYMIQFDGSKKLDYDTVELRRWIEHIIKCY